MKTPKDGAIRHLRSAASGSLSEWRQAVEHGIRCGVTQREVNSILFWFHPLTWILLAILAATCIGLVGSHLSR